MKQNNSKLKKKTDEDQKKKFQEGFIENVKTILRKKRHQLFLEIQSQYHTSLLDKFFDISELLREQTFEERISDSTIPIETIIEQNLEAIMGESTAY